MLFLFGYTLCLPPIVVCIGVLNCFWALNMLCFMDCFPVASSSPWIMVMSGSYGIPFVYLVPSLKLAFLASGSATLFFCFYKGWNGTAFVWQS